jgi:hypothetical protein
MALTVRTATAAHITITGRAPQYDIHDANTSNKIGIVDVVRGFAHYTGTRGSAHEGMSAVVRLNDSTLDSFTRALAAGLRNGRRDDLDTPGHESGTDETELFATLERLEVAVIEADRNADLDAIGATDYRMVSDRMTVTRKAANTARRQQARQALYMAISALTPEQAARYGQHRAAVINR